MSRALAMVVCLGLPHLAQQVEDDALAQAAAADVQRAVRARATSASSSRPGRQQAHALDVEVEVERGRQRRAAR